ncbi:MAG TPA: ABC transporter permease subunit [Candidatus Paceibacterota bacterium]|nr:ABC transporter permease subunit [Candidatus Paceibacterota bacterium]
MRNSRHIGHHHRHLIISYPLSLSQRLYTLLWGPLLFIFILFIALRLFSNTPLFSHIIPTLSGPDSLFFLFRALLLTLGRLFIAYVLALICAIPLALLCTSNRRAESIFLPIFDILESVPALAFFPILIIFFVRFNFLNGAAIFILFLSMLWNLVFTLVGGLKIIPQDIKGVAKVFGLRGWPYLIKVILPAIFPQFVTGSILAVAQGWNLIIVAEVLHVYIPAGSNTGDLFGLGSLLVQSAASGQNDLFVMALLFMILAIAFLNFFVWQKLLRYAERFRFE